MINHHASDVMRAIEEAQIISAHVSSNINKKPLRCHEPYRWQWSATATISTTNSNDASTTNHKAEDLTTITHPTPIPTTTTTPTTNFAPHHHVHHHQSLIPAFHPALIETLRLPAEVTTNVRAAAAPPSLNPKHYTPPPMYVGTDPLVDDLFVSAEATDVSDAADVSVLGGAAGRPRAAYVPPPPPTHTMGLVLKECNETNVDATMERLAGRWFQRVREVQGQFLAMGDWCPAPDTRVYTFAEWSAQAEVWWARHFGKQQRQQLRVVASEKKSE